MKNFVAGLFLVLIAISCQNHGGASLSLIRYIPKDTPVIIRVNNLSLLKSALINNDLIRELDTASFYNAIANVLKSTAYLKPKGEVLLCFNEIGKREFEYAAITRYRKNIFLTDSIRKKQVDTIRYDGAEIRRITTTGGVFFTTVMDSVFIVSSAQLLAENIVRQRNAGDIPADETFRKLYKTSDPKKSATVFINNAQTNALAGTLFKGGVPGYIRDFADWTTIELSVSPDVLACTGIAMAGPSSPKTVNLFHKTAPQQNATPLLTPLNATGFVSFTFDSYAQLEANLAAYKAGDGGPGTGAIKNDTIFKWINEIGLIFENERKSVVLHTLDAESTRNILTADSEPETEFREIPIYRCPDPQLITAAFSPLITNASVNFYAFTDDFILFSDTMDALKNIISNYQNKTTLGHSTSFGDLVSGLSNKASILMAGLQPGFKTALLQNTSEAYQADIKALSFKNYPYFALQVIRDRDFAHIASVIKKPDVKSNDNTVAQLFSIVLDADVAISPQFVTNHGTKQKEIVVQDTENTLYLIANNGKVLWEKKLDGRIQGEVQQVDLYRNGRLQLAFVTPHKLYITDRDGNDVAPFPLQFSTAVTQPLAVFDYDKNKDYRFLVCQGKKLAMYNGRGETVNGFTLAQTQSNVLFAPQHFKIGAKDYLVIPEENGKLNILHRNGKSRIEANRTIDFSENTVYLYNDKFTVTDKAGRLIQIDERGGMAVSDPGLDRRHRITAANSILVSLSDNVLTIKGKKATLDFGIYTPPRIFLVNNKSYIAVTDTQTNKVYVYDSNAALLPHFPVYGMGPASLDDIDNDNKTEFTVQGDKNAVLLYKMN
ncbi:MAG: ribonuclease HII [Sinomicrobium sp.]|nr:ribonuclease HII [Sinomicrobium sp.]